MKELSATEDSVQPGDTYGWGRSLSNGTGVPFSPAPVVTGLKSASPHHLRVVLTSEYGVVIFDLTFSTVLFHCHD